MAAEVARYACEPWRKFDCVRFTQRRWHSPGDCRGTETTSPVGPLSGLVPGSDFVIARLTVAVIGTTTGRPNSAGSRFTVAERRGSRSW